VLPYRHGFLERKVPQIHRPPRATPNAIRALESLKAILLGVLLCSFCPAASGEVPALADRNVVRFDAGPRDSALDRDAIRLTVDSVYSEELAYGWLHPPLRAFARVELARSRDSLTIDGVQSRQLGFRANVSPGDWYVTLWIEAGYEDANSHQVFVQGQPQNLDWQEFLPPAEPRSAPQAIYRVAHTRATVDAHGLSVRIEGTQDDVRLLGISLVRDAGPTTSEQRAVLQQLVRIDPYADFDSLQQLQRQVEEHYLRDRQDAFWAYWHERLGSTHLGAQDPVQQHHGLM
jgi:hypothetical protein